MRKIPILLISILIILTGSLTGCQSRNTGSEPWDQEKDMKKVTLTFYFPHVLHPDTKEVLKKLEKKAYEKLKVNLVFQGFEPSIYERKMYNILTEGKPCDGFVLYRDNIGPLIEPEMLKDVKTLFPRNAPDYYLNVSKELCDSITINGKLLGVPANQRLSLYNSNPYVCRVSLIVRSDILKKTGINEIKSLNDLDMFVNAASKLEPRITPIFSSFNTMSMFASYYDYIIFDEQLGLVYKANDQKMRLIPWEQTPEFKSCANLVTSWIKKGYMIRDYEDAHYSPENCAAYIVNWSGPDSAKEDNKYVSDSSQRFVSFDLCEGKKSYATYINVPFMAFNSNSLNVDRAIMFLEWLQSDVENYKLLMYGLEGKNYTFNEKEGYKSLEEPLTAYPGSAFNVFGNFMQFPWDPDGLKKDEAEYQEDYGKYIKFAPHLGFYVNADEINRKYIHNKIPRYYSVSESIFMENLSQQDNIDSFINSMKPEADKITSIIQPELNSWIEKNKNK